MKIEDLALSFVPNLKPEAVAHLLEVFGDAEAIYAASETELVARAGLRADMAKKLAAGVGLKAAKMEEKYCHNQGISILCSSAAEYPNRLKFTSDYPHIIYIVGEQSLLNSSVLVSLVGEQQDMSSYGRRMVMRIVEQLAELMPEVVIVGMLEGCVDSLAMRYAMNCGLRVVAVATSPLGQLSIDAGRYLADEILNMGGTVVSQEGLYSTVEVNRYGAAERIVAGMCDAVVVVECGMVPEVARCADSYGRLLCAVPGRATDSMSWGANRMISSMMAHMVCSGRDIVELLEES